MPMNFQQLRAVREAVRQNFNLTEVAKSLHTSQPGVSRQIREFEEELGFEVFERSGKRLTRLTHPGVEILPIVEKALREIENLKRAGNDYVGRAAGRLVIATTHSQARYALPKTVLAFKAKFPGVELVLQQTFPDHIAELLQTGRADIGIATESLDRVPDLAALPGYEWGHVAIVPVGHPLAAQESVGLADLVEHPLITYDTAFTGRKHIDEAFTFANLTPNIVLSAMDADVIKTYVELGMGIGIVASVAVDPTRDVRLTALHGTSALFARNTTKVALQKGVYLRGYAYEFLELFAPHLTREYVQAQIFGELTLD